MKKQESKNISIAARVLAGILALVLIAGTVFGVLAMVL